jgi:hypothetical protein
MKLRFVGFPVPAGAGQRPRREKRDDAQASESIGQTHASNIDGRNGDATVESQPPTANFHAFRWAIGSWKLEFGSF